MSDKKRSKKYWQKRCIINENVLNSVIDIVGEALPSTHKPLTNLCEDWTEALGEIERTLGNDSE